MGLAPVELKGLQGNNPFDFLAALGIQVAFEHSVEQPRLWWSEGSIPTALVSSGFESDRIAEQARNALRNWLQGTGLDPKDDDGAWLKGGTSLKFSDGDARSYLAHALLDKFAGRFCMALIAEGSMDNNGQSKPTDLYFTAGQQKFLSIVKEVAEKVTQVEIMDDLEGQSPQKTNRSTLMLDVADDAVYAHSASNPSGATKHLKPGIEALAILGLSRIPVYGSKNRTLTQGCTGSWKRSAFEWPIWEQPATMSMVNSILASTTPFDPARSPTLDGWSMRRIYRSAISRSAQGGYGTFRPAEVVWAAQDSRQSRLREKRLKLIEIADRATTEARANGLTEEILAELLRSED